MKMIYSESVKVTDCINTYIFKLILPKVSIYIGITTTNVIEKIPHSSGRDDIIFHYYSLYILAPDYTIAFKNRVKEYIVMRTLPRIQYL